MTIYSQGFLLQASLILALGAQNLFVLESGLKKQNHLLVALICSICDAFLIAVGVAGAATLFVQIPFLKILFGTLGVIFLIYYGIKKIHESFNVSPESHSQVSAPINLKKVILLSLSFSLLNPHVYLDTVVLIGGYSTKFPEILDRIKFGFGAASFSALWFFGLSQFSYYLSSILKSQKAMKRISFFAGTLLLILAWKLGNDVYNWT